MDEMIWLVATVVLVVLGGAVAMFFVLGGSEGLSQYIEKFCQDNPGICGTTDESSLNYKIAYNSVDALACAINSVTLGKPKGGCGDYFNAATGTGGGGIVIIDANTREEYDDIKNDPRWGSTGSLSGYDSQPELPGGLSFTGNLGAGYHDFITGMVEGTELGLKTPSIKCDGSGDDYKCIVSDYTTPQNYNYMLATATEYIGGFGDPNFLVYYVKFPEGEDNEWSSITPWWRTLSGVVLLGACAGRLAGTAFTGIKIAGSAIKDTVKFVRPTTDIVDNAAKRSKRISKYFKEMTGEYSEKLDKKMAEIIPKIQKTSFLGRLRSGKIKKTTELIISDDYVKNTFFPTVKGTYLPPTGNIADIGDNQFLDMSRFILADLGLEVTSENKQIMGKTIKAMLRSDVKITDDVLKGAEMITKNVDSIELRKILANVWGLSDKAVAGKASQVDEVIKAGELVLSQPSFKKIFVGQAGAGIGAWFAAKLDSEVGKFVEEYPNSLVLRTALRPDLLKTFTLDLPDVESGSSKNSLDIKYDVPLMLDRSGFLAGGNSILYSASPCKADLIVSIKEVQCDSFRYEKGNEERASLSLCEQDETDMLEFTFDHKCNEVPLLIKEDSSRIREVVAKLSNNMNDVMVYTKAKGDIYDKIYYPLLRNSVDEGGYLYFKFDREQGKVTHISASIGDINKPGDNGDIDGGDMLPAKEYEIGQLTTDKSKGFKLGKWGGTPCVVNILGSTPERHLRIYNDDGCSIVTIEKNSQDFDMDILEGDRVIKCVFDGNEDKKNERGIIFQDYGFFEGEVRTSITFYYTVDANDKADEFIGIRIDQTSDENKMIINKIHTVVSLVLMDSVGPDGKRDGKIDSLSYSGREDYYNFHVINTPGRYVASLMVSDIDADGKPDNIFNTGCDTPAMMVKFDLGGDKNEDQQGNNYCIRKEARGVIEKVVVVTGIGASLVTAVMKATVVTSVIGIAIDCGLGLTEAILIKHNWPTGSGGKFRPTAK